MQSFNFGIRMASAESMDNSNSRSHVPSSVYSGPGPAEELPHSNSMYTQGSLKDHFEEEQPRYNPLNQAHPRSSSLLNINDPVAMHLLMETAITDSKEYEILSFEEVEVLKKEGALLRNRIDALQRKIALEGKLRDAAQSLNRLYSTKGRPGSSGTADGSPRNKRRSLLGSRGSMDDPVARADNEYVLSNRKIEELTQELIRLEKRSEETRRRVLEHNAGILQMTHKGLKKNLRKELPRSPESMASTNHRSIPGIDGVEEFDERSLYRVPDYVTDFGIKHPQNGMANRHRESAQALEEAEKQLLGLSKRLNGMILHLDPQDKASALPAIATNRSVTQPGAQMEAYLGYLAIGLDTMEAIQAKTVQQMQEAKYDSEAKLEDLNASLDDILQRTNTVGSGPSTVSAKPTDKTVQAQLSFSAIVLGRLNQRVDQLIEQKDILTRQIKQQRELNSKSDAQRDAHIQDLTEELAEMKHLHSASEQENQHLSEQMHLLMEQLDRAKQQAVLLEQQRSLNEGKALEMEKTSRREAEQDLQATISKLEGAVKQTQIDCQRHLDQVAKFRGRHEEAQTDLQRSRADLDQVRQTCTEHETELEKCRSEVQRLESEVVRAQTDLQRSRADLDQVRQTCAELETELEKCRSEMQRLESEVVRAQTDLTVVRAELDGAYGTRAQRAADVSMNPAIQKEIDGLNDANAALKKQLDFLTTQYEAKGADSADLQNKVNTLSRELKDTIEDYELMTKASIEAEKERDHLEATLDNMRERCEALETQLSDEKVKWLGAKSGTPTETTSTMVLKNEFKKMMRDTRAENTKSLRAEQEERRRLETVIRSMKKEMQQHTPTKSSSLSQSIIAEQ